MRCEIGPQTREAMASILSLKGKEWFIETSDDNLIKGPYSTAVEALQVALAEVVQARRRGRSDSLSVRDNHGIARQCRLITKPEGATCFQCESLWPKEFSSVTPRCPLWKAFSPFKP
jgi:hypothetical protein